METSSSRGRKRRIIVDVLRLVRLLCECSGADVKADPGVLVWVL